MQECYSHYTIFCLISILLAWIRPALGNYLPGFMLFNAGHPTPDSTAIKGTLTSAWNYLIWCVYAYAADNI